MLGLGAWLPPALFPYLDPLLLFLVPGLTSLKLIVEWRKVSRRGKGVFFDCPWHHKGMAALGVLGFFEDIPPPRIITSDHIHEFPWCEWMHFLSWSLRIQSSFPENSSSFSCCFFAPPRGPVAQNWGWLCPLLVHDSHLVYEKCTSETLCPWEWYGFSNRGLYSAAPISLLSFKITQVNQTRQFAPCLRLPGTHSKLSDRSPQIP